MAICEHTKLRNQRRKKTRQFLPLLLAIIQRESIFFYSSHWCSGEQLFFFLQCLNNACMSDVHFFIIWSTWVGNVHGMNAYLIDSLRIYWNVDTFIENKMMRKKESVFLLLEVKLHFRLRRYELQVTNELWRKKNISNGCEKKI